MVPSLYRYVWTHTRRQQLWMLVVVLLSVIPLYLSLNLPKLIINGPIQGQGFESGPGGTDTYFIFNLPEYLPWIGGRTLYPGFELERLEALYALSTMFLTLVVINGAFKFYLNIYKGRLGERMLRRMRYELVDRVLRFPLRRFRRLRAAEVSSMVKDELEPIGGFIGDAFIQPVYLGSQIITAMVFIFVQSLPLGMVALGVMLLQVVLIPRMRRRLLILGRERQLAARRLAGSVGEIVESMTSIRTNDVTNFVRARISADLGEIFLIRFDIYQWKFFVKFLNNFLSQATPFIFYMFGGYFAITGQLDIGALVAVIAAYRELPAPLKDLIDWDLMRLDVNVKYEQVAEQFDIEGLVDERTQAPAAGLVAALAGPFELRDVTVRDESGIAVVNDVTLTLPLDQRVAAIGPVGDGAEAIAEVLASLITPSEGNALLGSTRLSALPETVRGRRIAFIDAATYYPQSSLRNALFYPLMHRLQAEPPAPDGRRGRLALAESIASGNSTDDPTGDWVDHSAIGESAEERLAEIAQTLRIVQLEADIRRIGLNSRVPPPLAAEAASPIIAARRAFRRRLAENGLEGAVERFDATNYLDNATVIENIVFGASRQDEASASRMLFIGDAKRVLTQTGLDGPLAAMGRQIAETLVELFGTMGESNPLLRRMAIIGPDEIDTFRQILARQEGRQADDIGAEDRRQLIRLALGYAEPRYRLGLIDDAFRRQVVEARIVFQRDASAALRADTVFYDEDAFNDAASIRDNIVFGRIAETTSRIATALEAELESVIAETALKGLILEAALEFDIGAGGKRLSLSQQQRLALARAILKGPSYLVANRCLSSLDAAMQAKVIAATLARSVEDARPFGIFWVVGSDQQAEGFDRLIRLRAGRIAEDAPLAPGGKVGLSSTPAPRMAAP